MLNHPSNNRVRKKKHLVRLNKKMVMTSRQAKMTRKTASTATSTKKMAKTRSLERATMMTSTWSSILNGEKKTKATMMVKAKTSIAMTVPRKLSQKRAVRKPAKRLLVKSP